MESSVSVTTGALFDKERWMDWMNEMAGNRLTAFGALVFI